MYFDYFDDVRETLNEFKDLQLELNYILEILLGNIDKSIDPIYI
jgi:hypothetical protein